MKSVENHPLGMEKTPKSFEIVAMGLTPFVFWSGRMDLMLVVLFLMALHSTFFSPAKYGILPEMLPDKDLSRANGLVEMSTFMAIILGTSLGSMMFASWKDRLGLIGMVLILIAIAGTVVSFGIPRVAPSGSRKPFRINPWSEIICGVRRLYREKNMWLTVVGISYFWFLGALLQMVVILFGKEVMHLDDLRVGLLGTSLAAGIGIGSLAAGRLSGDKVELGLVPIGSICMGIFSVLLSMSASSYAQASILLALLGFSGGLFIVPLNAFLQQRCEATEKGQIMATNNFLNTAGILVASASVWIFRDHLSLSADRIIFIFGLFTIVGTIFILKILPDFLIRFTLWLLTHTIYKIRIVGQENVPFRGPALLVCNHMSFVDGFLVGGCVQRFVRFMVYRPYYYLRPIHWLFRLMKAIPVAGGTRKDVFESLERAREELRQGHVVCIYAEGAISRTGNLLPFKRGFEKIVEGLDIPIIPVHLDRLWGSIFSFKDGRFFWKWPEKIPYSVTVSFGRPLASTTKAWKARLAIMELGSEAAGYRRTSGDFLHLRFLKTAKRRWFSFAMSDSSGKELTYGKALIGSLVISRWVYRHCRDEKMIGIMLPASIGGALANIALLLAGKIPVNINFTAGQDSMASAIRQCGMRTIVTSRIFLSKAKFEEMPGMVFLEDIVKSIPTIQKVLTGLLAILLPARLIEFLFCRKKTSPDAPATVMFSSGSTGVPKGVVLSHHNILSNIESLAQIFWVTPSDRMMGVLPFFHSFGFTGTLWFPLLSGFGAVYHVNPMDAKSIGELLSKYKATILISTPTFYSVYLRRCTVEQFSSLRFAIVGAEKLREPIAKAFKETYGLHLLEGYGCTEMGPVVAVNIPDYREDRERQIGIKSGTVGHPIPGVSVKVVDPETNELLPNDKEGLLLVKGPNRMIGYLDQPEKTAEVFRDGWYSTGDIGFIDEDGFISITDRLSRFSKIGGEMVPHLKVEDAINQILGEPACAIASVPDEQRGERLVVFYTRKEETPESLWNKLSRMELPKLWIPKMENMHCIEAIPLLGTGKVDLKKIKAMALELASGQAG